MLLKYILLTALCAFMVVFFVCATLYLNAVGDWFQYVTGIATLISVCLGFHYAFKAEKEFYKQ